MVPLENQQWQKIPGASAAWIFPCIRKPSIICSNTYLVATDEQLIVIDPGTDELQMKTVLDEIATLMGKRARPLFVYLTHCHVDHSHGLPYFMSECGVPLTLLLQEEGVRALSSRDRAVTQAECAGLQLSPLPGAVSLLTREQKEQGGEITIPLPGGGGLTLFCELLDGSGLEGVHRQTVRIGRDDLLEIYHTPGHSPDSLSFRIGDSLFLGDLLFAANPGVAGIVGWNREELLTSLRQMEAMVARGGISLVLAGHGRAMDPGKCAGILREMHAEATGLVDIVALDSRRMGYLDEFAVLLLEEAGTAFATIAGRLCAVSHFLERLEEPAEAARVMGLMEMDAIDGLVEDFFRTVEAVKVDSSPEGLIIQKGVQFTRRVEELLPVERVSYLVDLSLLRRTKQLLQDFLNAVMGFRFQDQGCPEELNGLLHQLIRSLQAPPGSDELFAAVEDDRAYIFELSRRIACRSPLNEVRFDFVAAEESLYVNVERDGFMDAVMLLLELLAVAGQREISLEAGRSGAAVRIEIALRRVLPLFSSKREKFLKFYFARFGGTMRREERGGEMYVIIELPSTGIRP